MKAADDQVTSRKGTKPFPGESTASRRHRRGRAPPAGGWRPAARRREAGMAHGGEQPRAAGLSRRLRDGGAPEGGEARRAERGSWRSEAAAGVVGRGRPGLVANQ